MDQIKFEKEGLGVLEDLFKAGKYEDALKCSQELFRQFPSSFQIGLVKSKTLIKLTRYEDAEESVDELLRIYPENINLLVEKGNLLAIRGRGVEAGIFFDKALFLDPFNNLAKEGLELTKKTGSVEESPTDFISYEQEKLNLEDTIRESDLEKLMELNKNEVAEIPGAETLNSSKDSVKEEPQKITDDEGEPVSISFEDSSLLSRADILSNIEESGKKNITGKSNIELALDELNEISRSDLEAVEEVKKEPPIVKDGEREEKPDKESEDFITESAAILYLKQGLYDDARNIYSKLYEASDDAIFEKKLETLQRVKIAHLKIRSLENFLSKLTLGRNKIV